MLVPSRDSTLFNPPSANPAILFRCYMSIRPRQRRIRPSPVKILSSKITPRNPATPYTPVTYTQKRWHVPYTQPRIIEVVEEDPGPPAGIFLLMPLADSLKLQSCQLEDPRRCRCLSFFANLCAPLSALALKFFALFNPAQGSQPQRYEYFAKRPIPNPNRINTLQFRRTLRYDLNSKRMNNLRNKLGEGGHPEIRSGSRKASTWSGVTRNQIEAIFVPSASAYARSKRSRFITLLHAATKSCTNACCESPHA
jgi:hypothetical protein